MALDWDDLHSFLMITRHGTLSAAARALGVQQSTMGRRLEALEARAGARLLQRTPSGFVPTPAGEAILGAVERIESETLAVERIVTGRDVKLEGLVRLTTVESLAVDILMPGLARFQARYPAINVELVTDTRSLNLSRHEADVALRIARPEQPGLAVRRAGSMANQLYASPGYIDRHGMPDLEAAGTGHRSILVQADLMGLPEMRWMTERWPKADVALRSNSRFVHRAAAEAGMGIACLVRYLGDPAVAAGKLVPIATPTPPPEREIWLAVHDDIRHMPRIRALTDFLMQHLKTMAHVLAPDDSGGLSHKDTP